MISHRLRAYLLAAAWPLVVGGVLAALGAPLIVTLVFTAAALLGSMQILRARPPRSPTAEATPPPAERCPRCGAEIYDGDRDTSTGRAIHTYFCRARCGWVETRDHGVALWKGMREP